ncbi:MAG TPA: methyltransferase domain-containing protein [Methylomirabilota bacterium]|nr:methyltransferase domain-containing protein [Methylomirabilota bacterium]
MGSAIPVRFRCPDCLAPVGPLEGSPACPKCGRVFGPSEGVWDLRPQSLEQVKANEDEIHAEEGLATWRRLFFHKRHWIEWCQSRFLPTLLDGRTRAFLEIGGGLCYASALAKEQAPQAFVLATDLSPRYLRHHAVEVGRIMHSPADVYAAVDAESLPFEDEQFEAVYSQVVLYRLPDPVQALREIRRVLAPGGSFLGIERASPWASPFATWEAAAMRERAEDQGIAERPRTYREWEAMLAEAGLKASTLAPVAGRRVRDLRLRRLINAWRPIHVTIRLTR